MLLSESAGVQECRTDATTEARGYEQVNASPHNAQVHSDAAASSPIPPPPGLASCKPLGLSKRGVLISIQILSLEVVLQRLHLEHGRQHQDADLEHWPPYCRDINPFRFSVKFDLLLLHVVRLVQYFGQFIIQLDDLDLEPVLRVELVRRVDALMIMKRASDAISANLKFGKSQKRTPSQRHFVFRRHFCVIFLTVAPLDFQIHANLSRRLGLQTQIVGRLGARRHAQFTFVVTYDLAEDLRFCASIS